MPTIATCAVMRRDLASGETQQLIRGFGSAIAPQLSPNDKRIAFVRRVREKTVLFVYDIAHGQRAARVRRTGSRRAGRLQLDRRLLPAVRLVPGQPPRRDLGQGQAHGTSTWTPAQAKEIPFSVRSRHKITVPPRFTHDLAPKSIKVRAIRQLAYSPDDRVVVFNALGRLWRKQDDAKPPRLTRASTFEFEPAFSRDGRKVAYVDWNDESGSRLMVGRLAGRRAQDHLQHRGRVAHAVVLAGWQVASYSRSMRAIAVSAVAKPASVCIGSMPHGGEAHYIGAPGDAPMFSPDGQRIYYSTKSYINHAVIAALESVNLDGFDQARSRQDTGCGHVRAARQPGSEVDRVPSSSAVLRDPPSPDRRAGDADAGERQRQSRDEAQ